MALGAAAQARDALTDEQGRLLEEVATQPTGELHQRVAQFSAVDLEDLDEEMAEQLETELVAEEKIYAKVAAARTKKIAEVQKLRKGQVVKKNAKPELAEPPTKHAVEAADLATRATAKILGAAAGSDRAEQQG